MPAHWTRRWTLRALLWLNVLPQPGLTVRRVADSEERTRGTLQRVSVEQLAFSRFTMRPDALVDL